MKYLMIVGCCIFLLSCNRPMSSPQSHSTSFYFEGINESEREYIQGKMIDTIKFYYLDNVDNIYFYNTLNETHGSYLNGKIKIYLQKDDLNDTWNWWVLCHELLHSYGLEDNKVMNELSNYIPCFNYTLSEKEQVKE